MATARQKFADVLRKHRIEGMGRDDMLGRYKHLGVSGFNLKTKEGDPDLSGLGDKVSDDFIDDTTFTTFVDKLYSGKMDTARDRQQRRQIERHDFAKQQRAKKRSREAAFVDKMDRQRKESAAKFGGKMGDGPDTPGLDRIAAMQGTKMGTSTAHTGEIAKGVGPQSRRTVTPRSAVHGVEARAHEKAGNKAAAAQARARQFAERAGEPNIRGQAEKERERKRERDARGAHLEDKAAREKDAAEARRKAEAERNR
tara:strand:+ start:5881 stop:6645 length:765 start_codon:yes stop_codon:yes gene_type:complete